MPIATGSRLTSAEIADVMRRAGWPPGAIPIGVAIALAESGGNPRAVNNKNRNGSTDRGLFQINSIHKTILSKGDVFDPVTNARMALQIYREAGNSWRPWSTWKSGSYKKFYKANPGGNAALTSDDNDGGFWGGVADGMSDTAKPVTEAGAFTLGFIGTSAFWTRFAIGLIAVGLIIVGIVIVFRRPLGQVAKGAINLTPQGRAVNVATGGLKK